MRSASTAASTTRTSRARRRRVSPSATCRATSCSGRATTATRSRPSTCSPATRSASNAACRRRSSTAPTTTSRAPTRAASGSRTWRRSRARLFGPRDRALELGLAHLRAALDVQLAGLGLELLARRLVAATDGRRLLAQRGVRLGREVLEGLLALRAGLRLLDVALRGLALFLSRHSRR